MLRCSIYAAAQHLGSLAEAMERPRGLGKVPSGPDGPPASGGFVGGEVTAKLWANPSLEVVDQGVHRRHHDQGQEG